jgi:hypothetical protein
MTEQQRIAVIAQAVANSKSITSPQFVEDFTAEVKSQEVLGEHGLLDAQVNDIEDEMSLIDYDPIAESIDEEDEAMEISDEMKGVYK